MILLTQGELGGDKVVRKGEFVAAMGHWGWDCSLLKFPDLGLIWVPLQRLVARIMKLAIEERLTTLVSFSPGEITYGYDHPDHNRSGEATRIAGAMMLKNRPKLYLWTSRGPSSLTEERLAYAQKFYGSQKIERKIIEQLGESYIKVR